MKTIIAGSRTAKSMLELESAIKRCGWEITEVVSGVAKGADTLGIKYARKHGLKLYFYPADWLTYGKSAGYRRNVKMADNADALVALWDGESRGTKHMIDIAREKGLKVYVEMML